MSGDLKLATLHPRHDRLDRDLLLFMAGRASVEDAIAELGSSVPGYQGRWSRSTALWSGSFAAMTVVAATLLVILLTQTPNDPNRLAPVNEIASTEQTCPIRAGHRSSRLLDRNTLSSAPYHLKHIDALLASDSFDWLPADSTAQPRSARELINRKILTPCSIQMLLNESETSDQSPFDSSSYSRSPGAHS
jgi:hypothetical protein